MKRIKIPLCLWLFTVLLNSCTKEMMSYEGEIGVYFAVQQGDSYLSETNWPYSPFSTINFASFDTTEITVSLKVMVTGPISDRDRHFNLRVNPDSTTAELGVHYTEIPTQVTVAAGAAEAFVEVHLLKTIDLQEQERTLGLQLLPNEDFVLSFPEFHALPELTAGDIVEEFDASMHSLKINDFLVEPAVWYGSLQENNMEGGIFGVFTRKKMELITEVMGITYAEFGSEETMPLVRAMLITNEMQEYLIKRYNEGNPVLEEDGRLMRIGSVPWTSYVGVPWVPGS